MSQPVGLNAARDQRRRRSEERRLREVPRLSRSSSMEFTTADRSDPDNSGALRTPPTTPGNANLESVLPFALNCLFVNTKIFYSRLLGGQFSFRPTDIVAEALRNTWLSQISGFCRLYPFYTPDHVLEKFSRFLINANTVFAQQLPIDVHTVLTQLFRNLLHLKPFIHYNDGSSDFFHRIVLSPEFSPECPYPSTGQILKQSLQFQRLTFQKTPKPALFLLMPLVTGGGEFREGIEGILPDMSIEIDSEDEEAPVRMNLHAIIYSSENGYSLYIRPKEREFTRLWVKMERSKTTKVSLFGRSNSVTQAPDNSLMPCECEEEHQTEGRTEGNPTLVQEIAKHHYMSVYYSPQATHAEFQENVTNVISNLMQRLPMIHDDS